MGRQCQIKTMVPPTELTPPVQPDQQQQHLDELSETKPQTMILIKPEEIIEKPVESVEEDERDKEDKNRIRNEEQTVEPIGPIVITDPPSTIDPAATVGKWPTEPSPTESPITQTDDENETWEEKDKAFIRCYLFSII